MSNTGFKTYTSDGGGADLGDLLVRRSIFTEGGLWLWGRNNAGQLGDNSIVDKSSPVQTVSGGTNWKQIASGNAEIAAIKTDGTLWTCGYNNYGQLGDSTKTYRSSPVQTIAGGTNWKQVACGGTHIVAIKTDGTLWSCGYNTAGQLGDSTVSHRSSPVQTIAGGNNWKQVAAGSYHSSAIKTDGTLWGWGYNAFGQLGDNTEGALSNKSSPVQTIAGGTNWKQVSVGYAHTSAIKTDGTLWIWGYNDYGQLGDNSINYKSSPIQTIAGGTNWKQVSCGNNHVAAIKTDGTLWVWGYNGYGRLGDSTTDSKSSPVQTIAGGTNWKQVFSGGYVTASIKTDGTLWVWGYNGYGQLADNTTTNRSSPIQTIMGGTNWKVACGGFYQTLAIKDDIS